jgi:sphinganine C4-monooxygenase
MSTLLSKMLDHPTLGANSTLLHIITPTSPQPAWYYSSSPSLFPFLSDKLLSLAAPTVVYWVLSLIFHAIDVAQIPYFESKRIHESEEVLSRNKVTIGQVIKAVLWQQVVQTALGLWWLEDDGPGSDPYYETLESMSRLAPKVAKGVFLLLGPKTGESVLRNHGESLVRWVYWWGIPLAQMWLAL